MLTCRETRPSLMSSGTADALSTRLAIGTIAENVFIMNKVNLVLKRQNVEIDKEVK
jgi:hypothetical protein